VCRFIVLLVSKLELLHNSSYRSVYEEYPETIVVNVFETLHMKGGFLSKFTSPDKTTMARSSSLGLRFRQEVLT
jgi:hypothetical protein